jgi:hypothetical protein
MKTIPVSETDRSGRKRCGFFGFGKHNRCLNMASRNGPISLEHTCPFPHLEFEPLRQYPEIAKVFHAAVRQAQFDHGFEFFSNYAFHIVSDSVCTNGVRKKHEAIVFDLL